MSRFLVSTISLITFVLLGSVAVGQTPTTAPSTTPATSPASAPLSDEDQLKALATKLCGILMQGDRVAFEAMVADDQKQDVRWWWDASGKGKDFKNLYGKCEFEKIVDGSKPERKQVFIQRYQKDGVTKWGQFGTAVFEKKTTGEWKMIGYTL